MTLHFVWNGQDIRFADGETVAAALAKAGVFDFSQGGKAAAKSVFCGIGQCQSCLVLCKGHGIAEACLLPCCDGLQVQSLSTAGGAAHD